jgi:subtilisin family serine protease
MSSAWFNQIGLDSAIETEAKGGAGITIGVVDTGLVASNPEISGRVSTASSCAAATFSCSNGYTDDNGHGTATASIAAGSYNNNDLMSGVAPSATVLSEKVLNASGVGYDTDVANGIIRAANGGAQVINLSLTYAATSTIVSAINYAASKGAVIVWAGGQLQHDLRCEQYYRFDHRRLIPPTVRWLGQRWQYRLVLQQPARYGQGGRRQYIDQLRLAMADGAWRKHSSAGDRIRF